MKPAQNIKRLINHSRVTTAPDADERILAGALAEIKDITRHDSPAPSQTVWRIIIKSRITRFTSVAAIIAVAVLVGTNLLNGTSAWAQVVNAFNNVESVRVNQKMTLADGTIQRVEFRLRRPNLLYQDLPARTVIDNGRQRLTIDKQNRTAQFSDSFMPYKPLEEHYMFETINLFRAQDNDELEVAELPAQRDESTLVFSLKHERNYPSDTAFQGTAWVDAQTMLPKRMRVELTSEPAEGDPLTGEAAFSYEPIPEEAFAMVIPEGFTELPPKRRGTMSGTVLDEDQRPVANAIVYVTDRAGQFLQQTTTSESGQFAFELPPEGAGKPVWLPVLLRAVIRNVHNRIAWSIIPDPAADDEPGGRIPYDVSSIDNDTCILKSANGITLRMEPAGTTAGQVTDADGHPILGAQVKLLRCDLADKHGNAGLFGIDVHKWSGPDDLGIVRTDENGWYELHNLPQLWERTKVFVHCQAHGFVPDTQSFYAKGPIEYEELDFQLYQAGLTVTGTLNDNYGKPLEGAPVYAVVDEKTFRACSAKTDHTGFFALHGCPDTPHLKIKAELAHGLSRHSARQREYYEYFPDVLAAIEYHHDKSTYEVEMIAQRPEFVFNVQVKNTSGQILKYFPVEIRAGAGKSAIPTQWAVDKGFTRRTDENGMCTFTEVPDVDGLKLVLYGGNRVPNEDPPEHARKYIEENRKKYFWAELPVEIKHDQKQYNITAVALTDEESHAQREN